MKAQSALTTRLAQAKDVLRAAGKIAAAEAMTWDVFRWTVVTLLVANLLLFLILYSRLRSEISSMEQDRADYKSQVTGFRGEVDKKIAGANAKFTKALAAMQVELRDTKASLSRPTPQLAPEQPIHSETQAVPMPTRAPRR
jgi:hypothetical protein